MKLAFVILNYGTYKETYECIISIKKHIDVKHEEYNITVVDNDSPDDSFIKLKEKFNESNIDFISTGKNLGFAKGNNVGIRHVNKNYSPEFVVVLNSDTEIFQDDLYFKLKQEYEHSGYALLGPMITLSNGKCNDSPWKPIKRSEVESALFRYHKEIKHLKSSMFYFFKVLSFIRSKFFHVTNTNVRKREDFWKYQTQVELQGAFLVFSKKAFDYIQGFDPRTFLYYEEQLLYLSLVNAGQTIVYDPRISIYHKDGCSTKKLKSTSRKKLIMLNQYNVDSLEILLDEMDKMQKKAI